MRSRQEKQAIAANTTRMRVSKGMSKVKLALASNISEKAIFDIENASPKYSIDLSTLTRLAIALGVTTKDLKNAQVSQDQCCLSEEL